MMLGFRSSLKRLQAAAANDAPVRQSNFRHRAMRDWERRLHAAMRITWPCEASLEFQALWPSVSSRAGMGTEKPRVHAHGDDGEIGFSRAIWCLTRHLKPRTVVESGVGPGLHARFILEALVLNGSGHLYSIDPPTSDPMRRRQVGVAVVPRVAQRWSLFADSGKRTLPELLSRIGAIDLFVHDNPRWDHETRFEIDLAWQALRPGGVMIIDDIDINGAYQSFIESHADYQALICDAEPFRPDVLAFNSNRQFAILFKRQAVR